VKDEVAARELTIGMARASEESADSLPDFEALLDRFERKVLGTAMRLLGNREDARDAAQEVFLRLHKYRRSYDPSRNLEPWVYKTTVNVCFDLRHKRRELPLEESADPPAADARLDERLDEETRRTALKRALLTLPEKMRAALVLRDIEGLPTREVAEILGCSEVTVRSQVSQARLRLRKLVAK
jgi:RNA polymerase sigma-70 factor (ECF subfamily)